MTTRPPFIKHWQEIQAEDNACYPNSLEKLSIGSPFGRTFGLTRLGIHHELLTPGRRTSWPHSEKTEEEFVYVIEGNPDCWLDGVLHRLEAGDAVGFIPGTGIAHVFINNTDSDVRLLVVGDTNRADNKVDYPLDAKKNIAIGDFHWHDAPKHELGNHDGLPDQLRESNGPF
ncbi:cupin domain-containing protein [Janthinobacterium sp. B9-8]|uniref:cupin domain-containing protein n=1 Tax=Janthinobacterium sp. B9-8 TaxID=1236179 RepID=UPI00061D0004|nr:cupin domain-containing protein [Janthinobacterium sp. B9-8]AMC35974.1 cupin [Janthinobacterium sp. B9-8]